MKIEPGTILKTKKEIVFSGINEYGPYFLQPNTIITILSCEDFNNHLGFKAVDIISTYNNKLGRCKLAFSNLERYFKKLC